MLKFDFYIKVVAIIKITTVFTEYVFCEPVGSAHNSQNSITFQEAERKFWYLQEMNLMDKLNKYNIKSWGY